MTFSTASINELCTGNVQRVQLECERKWIRAPVGSNRRRLNISYKLSSDRLSLFRRSVNR